MDKRRIGKTGLYTAPIVFGGNVFGWTVQEEEGFRILDAFFDAGFNMIDTADVYPRWATGIGGESEILIGKWMKKRKNRPKIILATKAGMDMGEGRIGLSATYIKKAADASLKRLQTDYIDLYQAHKDDVNTPQEETLNAFAQLIASGKIKHAGASNFTADRLQSALTISEDRNLPRYECLQPHYNLCERNFEKELAPFCISNNIGVITYYSLASGFLTGKYRSENDLGKSVRGRGASKYLNPKGLRILSALDNIAARHQSSLTSVALAWLIRRDPVTAPIVSASSLTQLKEITASAALRLTEEDMIELNATGE